MNDKQAEKIISKYIIKKLKKGITKISVLDFHLDKIKLPTEQIERILNIFEKDGRIKKEEGLK